jgi:hypothetical protein
MEIDDIVPDHISPFTAFKMLRKLPKREAIEAGECQ